MAREAARELRAISAALHPPVLDLFGLIPAVEWLAEQVMAEGGIAITVKPNGFEDDVRLSPTVELALFRCVQESLTNISKHAQAKNVVISIQLGEDGVVAEVKDDGVGFDAKRRAEAAAGGHLGMVGMRERLLHLDGEFFVESAVGQGTTLRFHIPTASQRQSVTEPA